MTVSAIVTLAWFGPRFRRPPPPPAQPPLAAQVELIADKTRPSAKAPVADAAPPTQPRRNPRRTPAPPDPAPAPAGDDFEILSAEELAAISQAR